MTSEAYDSLPRFTDRDSKSADKLPRQPGVHYLWPLYVAWSVMVGVSVTLRMRASMRLSATGSEVLLNAYSVSCLTELLSAVVFLPFSSRSGFPRHGGPALAATCLIPSASLIAASRLIGQCFVQMMLKFGTLLSAFAVDTLVEKARVSFLRLFGAGLVLLGVITSSTDSSTTRPDTPPSAVFFGCVFAALISGASYVLSARWCMPRPGSDAPSTALATHLCNSLLQSPALFCSWYRGTSIQFRQEDAPFWFFAALQGAFYMCSMQILPKRLGYAATFTATLATQLITATLLEVGSEISGARGVGLALVVLGAALAELGHVR